MGYDRLVRDAPFDPAIESQKMGLSLVLFCTHFAYEGGVRGQASKKLTANYPPEHPPQRVVRNSDVYLTESEESGYVSYAAGGSILHYCRPLTHRRDLYRFASRHRWPT